MVLKWRYIMSNMRYSWRIICMMVCWFLCLWFCQSKSWQISTSKSTFSPLLDQENLSDLNFISQSNLLISFSQAPPLFSLINSHWLFLEKNHFIFLEKITRFFHYFWGLFWLSVKNLCLSSRNIGNNVYFFGFSFRFLSPLLSLLK